MWECPDLFEVDNEYILIMSPEHLISDGNNYTNNTVYSIVGFDEESCDMKIDDEVMILDEGLDLYAAQTNIDKYGNRILIGWMRELKIYIDNGIIEVFINDGKYVISNIVYDLKSYVKVNGIEKIEINEMIF